MKIGILCMVLVVLGLRQTGPSGDSVPGPATDDNTLTLLFIGDIMQHIAQIESARDKTNGTWQYDSCFRYISGVISSADLAVANLEVTLGGKPYSGYPNFSAPDSLIPALGKAGIDVLVTANNHACDRGLKGLTRTVSILDSLGIPHTGTFRDQNSRDTLNPLILERKGIIIALLNYTYGTNGIPVPRPSVVNRIDTSLIRLDYNKAKRMGVDEVIVFFHWGEEYKPEPDLKQKEVAAFCHKLGIRIIIGSHPHVIQPMVALKDSSGNITDVTVYSLGNFISNQRDRYKNGGALFSITLKREQDTIQLINPGYLLAWVHTPFRNGKLWFQVLPVKQFERSTGYLSVADSIKFREFAEDSRILLNSKNIHVPEFEN